MIWYTTLLSEKKVQLDNIESLIGHILEIIKTNFYHWTLLSQEGSRNTSMIIFNHHGHQGICACVLLMLTVKAAITKFQCPQMSNKMHHSIVSSLHLILVPQLVPCASGGISQSPLILLSFNYFIWGYFNLQDVRCSKYVLYTAHRSYLKILKLIPHILFQIDLNLAELQCECVIQIYMQTVRYALNLT